MPSVRREYPISITFNRRRFTLLVIDPHYEENHPDMTDPLIIELVRQLDGSETEPESETNGFKYFVREVSMVNKFYRIILTYCEEDFLGVINAFRVKERKP